MRSACLESCLHIALPSCSLPLSLKFQTLQTDYESLTSIPFCLVFSFKRRLHWCPPQQKAAKPAHHLGFPGWGFPGLFCRWAFFLRECDRDGTTHMFTCPALTSDESMSRLMEGEGNGTTELCCFHTHSSRQNRQVGSVQSVPPPTTCPTWWWPVNIILPSGTVAILVCTNTLWCFHSNNMG